MIQLCDYGCGQPAIKLFKRRKSKGGDAWCCSNSTNSCSAIKEKKRITHKENTGYDNPGQNPAVATNSSGELVFIPNIPS